MQRRGAVRRVARADMIGVAAADRRVTLLEIQPHRASAARRVCGAVDVVALRGGDVRDRRVLRRRRGIQPGSTTTS